MAAGLEMMLKQERLLRGRTIWSGTSCLCRAARCRRLILASATLATPSHATPSPHTPPRRPPRRRPTLLCLRPAGLGWVDALAYEQILGPAYCAHECAKIAALKPSSPVTVFASLVPCRGGQWLTVSLGYRSWGASIMEGGSPERRHECLHMVQLDEENGEIVESPPHGRASRASAERYPDLDTVFTEYAAPYRS